MSIGNRFYFKVMNRLGWIYESFLWGFYRLFPTSAGSIKSELPVTIGITTFLNRYELFFKPLVRKLVFLFPECRVIVAANGSVLKEEQKKYLHELREFCGAYENIELIAYEDPRGLSHLWNRIMESADIVRILILNDDLNVKTGFGRFLKNSGILNEDIATINSSWSHFLISRNIFSLTGEFDEGLKEAGGEDDDYLARLALLGIRPAVFMTGTVARRKKRGRRIPTVNSYGRDMRRAAGAYSNYNTDYLRNKWEISDEYFDGSVELPRRKFKYWKLKERGGI